jgi:hypothetical protein
MTESAPIDELDTLVETTACRQSIDRPYGDRAQILPQVDDHSGLLDVPVAICCPNSPLHGFKISSDLSKFSY